jgi:hypothetical protein
VKIAVTEVYYLEDRIFIDKQVFAAGLSLAELYETDL